MKLKIKILATCLLLLSACGGETGSPNSTTPVGTGGVVNGYYLTSSIAYDTQNRVVSEWFVTTNYAEDRLESTITNFAENGDISTVNTLTSFYDSQGRLVREDYDGPDGSDTTNYTFNEQGLLSEVTREGVTSYKMSFGYIDSGQLISRNRLWQRDSVDSLKEVFTHSYGSQGLLLSVNKETTELPLPASGDAASTNVLSTYVHDNRNRIIRRERITLSQGNTAEETEVSDYTYDEHGNVIEEIVTGSDGVRRYDYAYEISAEPIFNTGLRRFRYFP